MFVSIWNAQLSESEIKYYLSIYLKVEQEIASFARVRARGVSPVVQGSVGHIRFAVCADRSRDNNFRLLGLREK